VLIPDLPFCLIEEKPLQAQQRPDHVFSDSLCLALGLSPDFAVDVETCMAPVEDLSHQRKPDEHFPQKQREDHMGEDLLDNLVVETTDMVKNTVRGYVGVIKKPAAL
jgi:hypothetical protein